MGDRRGSYDASAAFERAHRSVSASSRARSKEAHRAQGSVFMKVPRCSQVSRHAQSSMEYLMITGIVLVAIVGILAIGYSQQATFSREVSQAQTEKIGRQIIDAANSVAYAGAPSKKTLTLYFPDNLQQVVLANTTITFIGGGSASQPFEYLLIASTNVTGEIRTFPGIHRISLEATDEGLVNITDW